MTVYGVVKDSHSQELRSRFRARSDRRQIHARRSVDTSQINLIETASEGKAPIKKSPSDILCKHVATLPLKKG